MTTTFWRRQAAPSTGIFPPVPTPSAGVPYWPQTLPSGSVVGRLGAGAGPTEVILLSQLGAYIGATRTQRSIASAGDLPIGARDSILILNSVSDLTPTVPAASTRSGSVLTFKNLTGSHAQTLGRTGADTLDGQTSIELPAGSALTLVPLNDGINTGYAII